MRSDLGDLRYHMNLVVVECSSFGKYMILLNFCPELNLGFVIVAYRKCDANYKCDNDSTRRKCHTQWPTFGDPGKEISNLF